MQTRSSASWVSVPGSLWKAGSSELLPSDNPLGIPFLHPYSGPIPATLEAYGTRRDRIKAPQDCGIHFFLDDYRFERVWNFPRRCLSAVQGYGAVLTPDFSLYSDWPQTLQMWNVYRNRWMGAWWQKNRVDVIPTVSWAGADSYSYCFLGIPSGAIVAVSTVGVIRSADARELFIAGYQEMVRQLSPSLVLVYGRPIREVETLAECRYYGTRWDKSGASRNLF